MRVALVWLCAVVFGGGALPSDAAPELWLAAGESCNSCGIFDEVVTRRGYGATLAYEHAEGIERIPLRRVEKSSLTPAILAQLPKSSGVATPQWPLQLTVIVVDQGRVLAAGNIAESADPLGLVYPQAVMFPPSTPADDHPAARHSNLYLDYFRAHWNLEYFLAVAFGERDVRGEASLIETQTSRAQGPHADVIVWASAATPLRNASFIAERVRDTHRVLSALVPTAKVVTLYGHGTQGGNDTSYYVDGKVRFRRADVPRDGSAAAADVSAVLSAVQARDGHRSVLWQVGHSGPAGAPLWGHGLPLTADDLAPLSRRGDLVMVSGACHGGQFAKAVDCGFFAAHPDAIATGCQLSASAVANSDDYLRFFLAKLNAEEGGASLAEAHWYASARVEDHQITYSVTDLFIDQHFEAHPDALPKQVTVRWLREHEHVLTPPQRTALGRLTQGLDATLEVSLSGHVARHHEAIVALEGMRERSSQERNEHLGMPYKLVLPLLARRVVYLTSFGGGEDFARARACEERTLANVVGGDAPLQTLALPLTRANQP